MEKLKLFMIMLVLGGLGLVGCDDNDPEGPEISATTFVAGSEPGTAELRVPEGAEVVYRFDIKSAAPISKIEVWYRPGLGANMEAPMEEKTIELYGEVSEYVVSDTLTLDEDCSYSVYVEDVNRNFSSARVNLYLDVTKYNVELTDGMPAATSKTFLCLETGRTFYVANIANDPKGIDLGFTYYEGNDNKACLVSLDEYYKTGNYAMVVNDLNPEVIFKDVTDLVTKGVFDEVDKASDLKDIFDRAKDYPTVLDYTAGKIAPALEEEDMIAFRTEDGRYGVMKVKEIDRKNEDVSNNQTISLDVVVEKN
ncbi:hypothetical protein [uncultured Alistipes sp.]|uniref:hypothetical protein n=1 Tax=uncultured Alistipes sp. TaxID=538949 RepID=UPI0025968135|nr:hypothetical protein [uncultured Alistipes sp.]